MGEPEKNDAQITVKLPASLRRRLAAASAIQGHKEGQLARLLVQWALPFYEKARSIEALPEFTDLARQVEHERKLFAKDRKQKARGS